MGNETDRNVREITKPADFLTHLNTSLTRGKEIGVPEKDCMDAIHRVYGSEGKSNQTR